MHSLLSIYYFVLGMSGLSFLIFLHELGHFIVARRAGMKVEVFSIGFGKPLFSKQYNGVRYQISILLFGGYVKIAGMESDKGNPYDVKNGFYSKSPLSRILVSLAGPFMNIFLAFILLTYVWASGGRMRPFNEVTNTIGWVDPTSEISKNGVKPGDVINTYDDRPFNGFKDLIYNGLLNKERVKISGEKIDYFSKARKPFNYELPSYQSPSMPKGMNTIGVLRSASFLVFNKGSYDLWKHSPAYHSNIEDGDRIIWANGELIFSLDHLKSIVNLNRVLLRVERNGDFFSVRVPVVQINDLFLKKDEEVEFLDWKRASGIVSDLGLCFMLPYLVNDQGVVVKKLDLLEKELFQEKLSNEHTISGLDAELSVGDKVVGVSGHRVRSGSDLFKNLQEKNVLVIVHNEGASMESSRDINNDLDLDRLKMAIDSIWQSPLSADYKVLRPIVPISLREFLHRTGNSQLADNVDDDALYLLLGGTVHDKLVGYNPDPVTSIKEVVYETFSVVSSLFQGNLNPKWLSGPVGIVKVMQDGWKSGFREAVYWMALISLNLGLINLLPLPVLDGGHITISLWELISRKRLPSWIIERMALPFIILFILFLIYITYQDVFRLFIGVG